jgi:ABC-type polysaccharide/polyol phosphate export permease
MITATTELWDYRTLVANLANRQIRSQFKQSFLGNLWSLINPLATLAVYTIAFGVILDFGRSTPQAYSPDLQSFPLYLFCALMMWSLFNRIAVGSMAAFSQSGSLLRKVYFPAGAPIVAHALAQIRQTMLEGLIAMLVLIIVGNSPWTFVLWPLLIPAMFAFALGIGLVLSLFNAYYKDVSYLINIITMLLFYCTPIIYSLERVGDTELWGIPAKTLLELNPLTQFVTVSRDLLYLGQVPSLWRVGAIIAVSLASLLAGWAVFIRYSKDVSEVV